VCALVRVCICVMSFALIPSPALCFRKCRWVVREKVDVGRTASVCECVCVCACAFVYRWVGGLVWACVCVCVLVRDRVRCVCVIVCVCVCLAFNLYWQA